MAFLATLALLIPLPAKNEVSYPFAALVGEEAAKQTNRAITDDLPSPIYVVPVDILEHCAVFNQETLIHGAVSEGGIETTGTGANQG